MLTQNPEVRKELSHLSDTADDAVRHIRHAVRDARDAAAPVPEDVKAMIAQLEQTIHVLAREGSSESLQAGRRLRERASAMVDRLQTRAHDGMSWAQDRMDGAVDTTRQRVVESPLTAVGIAALAGIVLGLMLSGRRQD